MIKREAYEELEKRYGDIASWAIWAPGEDDEESSINIEDMSVFDEPDLLDKIHSDFVIIGLNPSKDNPKKDKYNGSWWMFHMGKNDHKLRYAFTDTPIWGAYMTDLYKGQFAGTEDKLSVNDELIKSAIKELKKELTILGGKPKLIALGNQVRDVLEEHLSDEYEIYRMYNHGYRFKPIEYWKEQTLEILEELGL